MLEPINNQLAKDARIIDLGVYCSDVPVSFAKMGYTGVHVVDINPNLTAMPYADRVQYCISDFMSMPFQQASFNVVTAISVIEYGYQPERFFTELGRHLRSGSYFGASQRCSQQKRSGKVSQRRMWIFTVDVCDQM